MGSILLENAGRHMGFKLFYVLFVPFGVFWGVFADRCMGFKGVV